MTSARRREVAEPPVRRLPRTVTAASLVVVAAVAVLAGTFVWARPGRPAPARAARTAPAALAQPVTRTITAPDLAARGRPLSRSALRVAAVRVTLRALPKVRDHEFLTAPLNVWAHAAEHGRPLAVLPAGGTVAVSGHRTRGFAQIVRNGRVRWVHARYLSEHRPPPPRPPAPASPPTPAQPRSRPAAPAHRAPASPSAPSAPSRAPLLSGAPCPTGSGMECGLVPDAVALHRTVCAHFPQVKVYGGYRPDGEHADGHAVDIMVYSDSGLGQAIADWVRANAAALHVDDVIWSQHIWTTQRAAEGWRLMPDRGSPTANHEDHVHVRVF